VGNKGYAQNGKEIHFDHITSKEGLSQSSGHVIYQDKKGFMWFGTNDGLDRYDGYDMKVYKHDPNDSTSLSGNNISAIFEDKQGDFWVGTIGAGLNLFNRNTGKFKHYKVHYPNPDSGSGISSNSVSTIVEGSNGRLWIGTYNGLNYFVRDKQKFVHFFHKANDPKSLSSNYIN